MLIFLFGEDTYQSRQKLKEIKEKFLKTDKSGLNLNLFSAKDLDFDEFKGTIEAPAFLAKKRLIILENPISEGSADLKEKIVKYKPEKIKSEEVVIVFYQKNQIDRRDKLFKYLKKNAKSQEFKFFNPHQLNNWIKQEVETRGGSIEPLAVMKLAAYVGPDLWRMSNEIDKLIAFNPKLTTENIDFLVKSKIETNIFNLIDALGQRDKKTALVNLYQQEESGESEFYILTMIVYQFRNLIKIKDCLEQSIPPYLVTKKTGLHPYVVKKSLTQARSFSQQDLKRIYHRLLDLDLSIKTGRVEPKTGLDMFIMEI